MKGETGIGGPVGLLLWVACVTTLSQPGAFEADAVELQAVETIERLKPMCPETSIVRDGRAAAVIAVPPGPDYAELDDRAREAIESSVGVAPEVLNEGDLTESVWRSKTVIALRAE